MNDEIFSQPRIAPHSSEAEQVILGAILLDNTISKEVFTKLETEDFYIRRNQLIFQAQKSLYKANKAIEYVTLEDELKKFSEGEEFGGLDYLIGLPDKVPFAPSVDQYIEIIKKNSIRRKIISACVDYSAKSFDFSIEIEKLITDFEKRVLYLTRKTMRSQIEPIQATINNYLRDEYSDEIYPTYLYELNDMLIGFREGKYIALGAWTSVGKTTLALNLLLGFAKNNVPSLFISLETSKSQVNENLICIESEIDSLQLQSKRFTLDDKIEIKNAIRRISDLPIFIDDESNSTIDNIERKIIQSVHTNKIKIVFIDYFQLIRYPIKKYSNKEVELSEISKRIKNLAKELNIIIVLIFQLRERDMKSNEFSVKNQVPVPRKSDARDSKSITHDADVILLIQRDYYFTEDVNEKNDAKIIVAKNKNGPTGSIQVNYVPECLKFTNLTERTEIKEETENDFFSNLDYLD